MANPAAAAISSRRRKDWVLLRAYVFEDDIPKKVDVIKNSLAYIGSSTGKKHFTGVYGTNSGDAGGYLASNWARKKGKRVFFLDVWAEVPHFHESRAQMTREVLKVSHWLHLDRMSVDLRDEIKDRLIGYVKRKHGADAARLDNDKTCQQIIKERPELAMKLLDEDPDIGMLVHPVLTRFDEGVDRQTTLWAATIRVDRIFIRGAEMRYLSDIECVV